MKGVGTLHASQGCLWPLYSVDDTCCRDISLHRTKQVYPQTLNESSLGEAFSFQTVYLGESLVGNIVF